VSDDKKLSDKHLRISFSLPPDSQKRLEEIREISKLSSNSDVIRQALLLFEDYVKSPAEGYYYTRQPIPKDNVPVLLNVAPLNRQAP